MAKSVADVMNLVKEAEVKFVDFRFTDTRGKEQHVTVPVSAFSEDKFTGGHAWVTEYGSSSNPQQFQTLIHYSPLHNIRIGTCYPATLVTTADHDDRVVPSHSFKFAAAMQAAQGCGKPILIRIETQGSHGYRPTDKRIAELADVWAFALANMKPRTPSTAGR